MEFSEPKLICTTPLGRRMSYCIRVSSCCIAEKGLKGAWLHNNWAVKLCLYEQLLLVVRVHKFQPVVAKIADGQRDKGATLRITVGKQNDKFQTVHVPTFWQARNSWHLEYSMQITYCLSVSYQLRNVP